eukprot:scaffold9364_cov114-Alexandrium_tamarense.AAC.3
MAMSGWRVYADEPLTGDLWLKGATEGGRQEEYRRRPSVCGWLERGKWKVDDGWTTGGRTTRSNIEFQCKLYTQHLHNFSCNRADLGSTQAVVFFSQEMSEFAKSRTRGIALNSISMPGRLGPPTLHSRRPDEPTP